MVHIYKCMWYLPLVVSGLEVDGGGGGGGVVASKHFHH